jgi:hypothetical protein
MAAVQIGFDGVTVWVNGAGGYCLGRFGRMGIDVHCKRSKPSAGAHDPLSAGACGNVDSPPISTS